MLINVEDEKDNRTQKYCTFSLFARFKNYSDHVPKVSGCEYVYESAIFTLQKTTTFVAISSTISELTSVFLTTTDSGIKK